MAENLTLADLQAGDKIVWEHSSGNDVRLGQVVRVTTTQIVVNLGPNEEKLRFNKNGYPVGDYWPTEHIRPADAAGMRALAQFERREAEAELRENIEAWLSALGLEQLQRVMDLLREIRRGAAATKDTKGEAA